MPPPSRPLLRQPPDQPQIQIAIGTPSFDAFGDGRPKALLERVGDVGEFLGPVGWGELLHR
jgi:hypothetical protein